MPSAMCLILPVWSYQRSHLRETAAQGICQDLKFEAYGQFWDQFSGLGKTKQEEVILEDSWRGLEKRDKK